MFIFKGGLEKEGFMWGGKCDWEFLVDLGFYDCIVLRIGGLGSSLFIRIGSWYKSVIVLV